VEWGPPSLKVVSCGKGGSEALKANDGLGQVGAEAQTKLKAEMFI
jgi:hypothetical protein